MVYLPSATRTAAKAKSRVIKNLDDDEKNQTFRHPRLRTDDRRAAVRWPPDGSLQEDPRGVEHPEQQAVLPDSELEEQRSEGFDFEFVCVRREGPAADAPGRGGAEPVHASLLRVLQVGTIGKGTYFCFLEFFNPLQRS